MKKMKHFNIAIDGPAGAGKSTIAKIVAKQLGSIYVDTGAMYRAMALFLIRKGVKPPLEETTGNSKAPRSDNSQGPVNIHVATSENTSDNQKDISADSACSTKEEFIRQVEALCDEAEVSIEYAADGQQVVLLDGENVNPYLRTQEVSDMASMSSTVGKLRKHLVALQQKLAAARNVVMDGRDIGTVVLPDAELKIFLTASVEVRAKRRYIENVKAAKAGASKSASDLDLEAIKAEIADRDHRDMTRKESPLKQADDAVLVDTSDLSIDQVAEVILNLAADRLGRARVITASTAGFCFGVQNAVDTVYKEIAKSEAAAGSRTDERSSNAAANTSAGTEEAGVNVSNIVTYGPIIHNATVVDELKSRGVGIVNSVEEAENWQKSLLSGRAGTDTASAAGEGTKKTVSPDAGTIIIRSHGVTRETQEALEKTGAKVVDTTCTFVKKIHEIVERASREGKQIVVIGNHGHAETEGTVGWVSPVEEAPARTGEGNRGIKESAGESFVPVTVIETEEEARNFTADKSRPVCIVAQTTFNAEKFKKFVALISDNGYNIEVNETICNATSERQAEARRIAEEADVMIVIGDRQSSNTAKLYEICRQECGRTCFIQTAEELDLDLTGSEKVIGITAGASTPKKIIEEVQSNVRRTDF